MLPKVLAHKNLTDNELSKQGLDGYSSSPDAHPQTPSSILLLVNKPLSAVGPLGTVIASVASLR